MPLDLPESVLPLFQAAGWPSLAEDPTGWCAPADHPAIAILRELDGLTVGDCGTGEECARGDIAFGRDEELEKDEIVLEWQSLLATTLISIGEVHHFHGVFFIDSSGSCYQSSLIHEAFSFEGASFGAAVERLLLGRKGQPMLRPNQGSVSMYGETITASHPGIYSYRRHR